MRFGGTRITLRLHRFELIAFGLGLGGLVIALVLAAIYLDGLQPSPACFVGDTTSFECQRALDAFDSARGVLNGLLLAPVLLATYAIGLFFGVPIVARELERGTVRLAWSLSPSRTRWYAARVVPILVILVTLTFAAGVAVDRYFAAGQPEVDLANSFTAYGVRGGLLASRAVFVFAVGVASGAIIGRALPAMIIAAIVATIGLFVVMQVHQAILKAEAVVVIPPADDQVDSGFREGDLYIDSKFLLPDGTLVGYEHFADQGPPTDDQGNTLYPQVSLVIPGERYRFVEAREALALAAGSLVALLLAALVVNRRRPG